MDEIASELNARGLTTKPGPNTPARPLKIRSVHHILRNPYYAGVVTFGGVEYPGTHEPLVDAATWASVQDILVSRRNGERSRTHDHYLKGTVYCLGCGYRLILQHTRRRERQYEYFLCHRVKAGCPQRKALPVTQVEQRVADCYRSIALTVAQRERIEEVALARLRRQHETSATRIDELTREISALEANQAKLLDAYYADAVPRSLFLAEQRRLKAEHAKLIANASPPRRTSPNLRKASARRSTSCKVRTRPTNAPLPISASNSTRHCSRASCSALMRTTSVSS